MAQGFCTVMLKVHCAELPEASVAVQVTVEVPKGKQNPETGLQLTLAPAQLSVGIGVV